IVIEQPSAEALTAQRRPDLQRPLHAQPAMPAAIVAGAEDVVQGQTGVIERLVQERDAVDREQLRVEADEMRSVTQQTSPLRECLADERQVDLLEVAQATVDETGRPRRGPDRDVVLLDERGGQPTRSCVEQ